MEFSSWLSLVAVCALGAMSPGPSLGVIINITSQYDRVHGLLASIAHAVGVGCYAFIAALGLAALITQTPLLFEGLKILGAFFLVYLGYQAIRSEQGKDTLESEPDSSAYVSSISTGFLTAFLNPKLALFFLALFSQLVRPDAGIGEKMVMAATAAGVDGCWYVIVTLLASHQRVVRIFAGRGVLLQRLFGVLLIVLAAKVLWG